MAIMHFSSTENHTRYESENSSIPLNLETLSRQILRFRLDLARSLLCSMRDFWSMESEEPLAALSDLQAVVVAVAVVVRVGFKRLEAGWNMSSRVLEEAISGVCNCNGGCMWRERVCSSSILYEPREELVGRRIIW